MMPLEDRLREAGVSVAEPQVGNRDPESPWFIRGLAAVSGWLASLLLMAFFGLFLTQVLETPLGSLITGVLLVAGAYFVMRAEHNDFLEHAGLAISLAGQGFVIWSLYRFLGDDSSGFFAAVALFELILTVVMPATVHRFVTTVIAVLAATASLAVLGEWYLASPLLLIATVLIWSVEFRCPGQVRARQAVGYGIALSLMVTSFGFSRVSPMGLDSVVRLQGEPLIGYWLASALAGLVFVSMLVRVVRVLPESLSPVALALVGVGMMAAFFVSLMVPGLVVGLTLLVLGFASGHRVLQGLGILALLSHLSAYYYQLDITLLDKAGLLLVVGVVLLASRWAMRRLVAALEEAAHG
ncbi:DUF4401 domain-containing protein [Tamilnaduibacter salinus]|nr:DUF4401 domain-containing protein [Tamilnaduibacter salinus]